MGCAQGKGPLVVASRNGIEGVLRIVLFVFIMLISLLFSAIKKRGEER